MQDVEKLQDWICAFPQWDSAKPELDQLGVVPDSAGLYYQGLEVLEHREDVQGNVRQRRRHSFSLRRIFLTRQGGACWMEALSRWVLEQSRLGLTPVFHGAAGPCRVTAANARADWQKQPGTTVYTVKLDAEFDSYAA